MSLGTQIGKQAKSYLQWRFDLPRVESARQLKHFGTDYGGYHLDASLLHRESVIYSVGIGEDISFDRALIEQFGVQVEAFDPTPKVKQWLAGQELSQKFRFHGYGIADFDGEAAFYLPSRINWISHSLVPTPQFSSESTQVSMRRLKTVMQKLGHCSIDVLKMDVEGAEYGILEDLLLEKIPVRQLLVEFHHRFSAIGTQKTRRMLARLQESGMRICHVCPRIENFTLIQPLHES